MTNRLADETSPYLLQHSDNPVDWYPWGDEAFARAKAEGRPVFLSIGYAACHWCHVMEHESFEDPATAAVMNELFVNIKVDREERPDVDAIYMDAVQALTGRGGWPMSVFLTPDGVPFYGGTYYPPVGRHGMPSFVQVLRAVHEAWTERRGDVMDQAGQLLEVLQRGARVTGGAVDPSVLDDAVGGVAAAWDRTHGGLGSAPKFPQPMLLEYLLRRSVATGDAEPLQIALQGLRAMARGGIYDQLGGGFARYSVDARWAVPHFEKMLYDNAQLVPVYLHAWQLTGEPLFERVVTGTLEYLVREMVQPDGGSSATQDADSEGPDGTSEEGAFFVWTPEQVRGALDGEADAVVDAALRCFGVTEAGNFEHGTTVLALAEPDALDDATFERVRARLYEVRDARIRPATDDKVLASWNGLAIAAFAEAGRVMQRPDWVDVARRAADFVLTTMSPDGTLHHSWRAGVLRVPAFAEDHGAMACGLLELYRATFEPRWFAAALTMADALIDRFTDAESGGFWATADDAERLVVRPKEIMDNAVPAPNSLAADACARVWLYTGDDRYLTAARAAIETVGAAIGQHPTAFGRLLGVLHLLECDPKEVAVVGAPRDTLLDVLDEAWRPDVVVAACDDGDTDAAAVVPLLADRHGVDGRAAAYVCEGFACLAPVTDADALRAALD